MKTLFRLPTLTLSVTASLFYLSEAQAKEPYAEMLERLRSEITAKLPIVDEASRKNIVEAKDAKTRVEAVRKISTLDGWLSKNELDAKLAKFFILNEATPAALSDFAAKGAEQKNSSMPC